MEEVQESRHFQISKAISAHMTDQVSWTADASLGWGEPQTRRLP
jgi:hypothetical protein